MGKYPECFSDINSLHQKANFFSAFARWNLFNYHFSTALDYFYEAIHLRETYEKDISYHSAFDYGFVGHCYYQLGRFREGLKAISKAEDFFRDSKDTTPLELSSILEVKGSSLMELREFEDALCYLQEGVQINQKHQGDKYVEGLFSFDAINFCQLADIARSLREMGRYEESIHYFNQAILVGEKTCGKGHPYCFICSAEKAFILVKMGKHQQALKLIQDTSHEYYALHKKASTDAEAFGEIGMAWSAIGSTYLHLNKIQKAKEMYKKALHCSLKYLGKETPIIRRAHLGLGRAYLKEKKCKKGLQHLLKHLEMCANYGIRSEQMVHIFEEFQETLNEALQAKENTLYVQKASQEAALLSEKILGKDHALTVYYRQLPSKIDNSKVKI
jgi:tetratricopeptide (TPR) repeat protein